MYYYLKWILRKCKETKLEFFSCKSGTSPPLKKTMKVAKPIKSLLLPDVTGKPNKDEKPTTEEKRAEERDTKSSPETSVEGEDMENDSPFDLK